MTTLITAGLVAFVVAGLAIKVLLSDRFAALVLDIPNDRSLHDRPIPRTGGVGLMLAVGLILLFLGAEPEGIYLPAVLLAALFFLDDVRGLPVAARFAAQFAAAIFFLASTGPYSLLLLPFLVLGIVWSINLYNFMDGSNGLAGGMAVIGFTAYALAAAAAGDTQLALSGATVAGAAAGFLIWNFDPARIFMGDAGSIPLGFLAATIGVLGWQRGLWPFWFPLLVFAVFVVDSGLTLAKRVIHRENPLQAHRSHYYQRLIRMGWSHRHVALNAYVVMAATAITALWLRQASTAATVLGLALWGAAIAAIVVTVDGKWRASPARGSV